MRFVYTDEVSGREITCGLTLLKMAMSVIKPQLVINYRSKEREIEEVTLSKLVNDFRNYLTQIQ